MTVRRRRNPWRVGLKTNLLHADALTVALTAATGPLDDDSNDSGFTLVECIVSLLLLTIVLGAVATEVVSALRNSLLARQVSQAGDLMMEQSELVQQLPYSSVAMRTSDLSAGGDSRISAGKVTFGSIPAEPFYATSTGAVSQHISNVVRQGTSYKVARYVTTPDSVTCDCRRVTTFVTWTAYGKSHTRSTSTMVSNVNRGSASSYTWAATNPGVQLTVSRGSTLTLPVTVMNYGSPDSWTLTVGPSSPTWGSSVNWYLDTSGDGIAQAGEPRLDTVTVGTGITGTVPSGNSVKALAVFSVPSTAATGSMTVHLVATPSNSAGSAQTVDFTVTVS